MQNISVSLARISISAASLCLAVLALSAKGLLSSHTAAGGQAVSEIIIVIPQWIRMLLAGTGLVFLGSTAFFADWLVDSFEETQWQELGSIAHRSGASTMPNCFEHRGNELVARLRLYGGGYAALGIGISALILAMVWLFYYNSELQSAYGDAVTTVWSCTFAIITFFRMMTKNSGKLIYTVLALAVVLVLIFSSPFLLRYFQL